MEQIDDLSLSEIASWRSYDRLFCIPDHSYLAGMIAAAVGNFAGKSCKDHLSPTDCLPISELRANRIKSEQSRATAQRMMEQARVRAMNQEIEALSKSKAHP